MPFTNVISTGVPTWDPLPTPRDGTDPLDQANFQGLGIVLENRFRYLIRAIAPSTLYLQLFGQSKALPTQVPDAYWRDAAAISSWDSFVECIHTANSAQQAILLVSLADLPAYCLLSELRLRIRSDSTYTQTPVTKLTLNLISDAAGIIATATDPGTYGGSPSMTIARDVVLTMSNQVINKAASQYRIGIFSEAGAGSRNNIITSLRATIVQP